MFLLLLLFLHSSRVVACFSPQTSQIQFSLISKGGINLSVCRSDSLGTSHSTQKCHESLSFTIWELNSPKLLYCIVLYYTLLYIGVPHYPINISFRYSSDGVTYCCSYLFCHKMVTNGGILVFEVSIEQYWALLLDASM